MPLLLIIALLSVTGTFVDSASEKTGCDIMPNNETCSQYGCDQQPCSILCGQSSPYQRCEQICNGSTCNSMVCSSSVNSCLQKCPSGAVCKSFDCGASHCFQSCSGGDCGTMTCPKNAANCEQTGGSVMVCHSGMCQQRCGSGQKCNMTCSSSVKQCDQGCEGECFYRCDIEENKCMLDCSRGNCTKLESPTATNGNGTFQMGVLVSVVLGFMLAFVVFM